MLDTSQDTMMTTSDVADRCGVSTKTVRRWIHEGALDAVKLPGNGHYRVDPDALQAFLGAPTVDLSSSTNVTSPDDQEAPPPTDGGEIGQTVQRVAEERGSPGESEATAKSLEDGGDSQPEGYSFAEVVGKPEEDRADELPLDHHPTENNDSVPEQGSEASPGGDELRLPDEFEVIL